MRRWHRVRRTINYVNLSTPLGLLVARLGRARVTAGPDGLVLAYGYRIPFPIAGAFTIGNVVLTRHGEAEGYLSGALLRHEDRHASQYAACAGLPMLPLYVVAVIVSMLVCGNQASWNLFERLANLEDGNYPRVSPWWARARRPGRE
ncbi:hypothetical protein [Planobispora longispora]|uniref:DUF4157 domain-containing protein n=1 Tax=Planobispora longispora TaxID=28887 RepID=A0A8J3W614_9ACTN|nr:hypothetical protein [Planobispora longispora]BFE83459.1 hypothetical protein GCM10020093_060600 [Planobispora longispora]GIH77372.1 hypothetical protein Plo01_38010 [Planobispora longispora]